MPGIEDTVARLDLLLEPIAKRPVDLSDPNWMAKLERSDPLDEAGIKAEAEAALRALLASYAEGDEATRATIRSLFDRYTSFRWAVHLSREPTPEGFRSRLLHLSARDQGADPRDELLTLDDLCAQARDAGVDIKPILLEVAELSSAVDRYGFGSVRDFLLSRAR
ncbi:MAG TPA: hypothetical protein VGR06_18355 [Actinophytocola sp.]|uniref:hypothetical protein n=1 Tax=Actinophytocola sp. TaxID=1872138 RepID=UPI002E014045|nr:hypothetical protein [Actinophytocola sp.]